MIRDTQIAWRNARQYRGRLASLTLIIVLGCIASLVSVGFVARAAESSSHQITDGIALRTIDLSGGQAHPGSTSLSSDHIAAIRKKAHIVAVEPSLQASFAVKTTDIPGAIFYGTIPQPSLLPPIAHAIRKTLFPLQKGEVVLPDVNQDIDFAAQLGRTIDITYTEQIAPGAGKSMSGKLTVAGLYDHSYTADGPSAAYATEQDVTVWAAARVGLSPSDRYLAATGYQQAAVIVDQANNVDAVERGLAAEGYQAISVQQKLSALPRQVLLLRYIGLAVVVLLLLYCLIAGTSLAHSFVRQRTREIGLLKALGFGRRRILRILAIELLLAGQVPVAIGVLLGNFVSIGLGYALGGRTVLGVHMSHGLALPPFGWTLTLLLAPVLAIFLGGLWPARRSSKLEADVALRDWQ
jgi:putative ABC transport system permease protein